MSRTDQDDLRARIDELLPVMTLDVATVRRAGRQRRRTQVASLTAISGAAAALVVGLALHANGLALDRTEPAGPSPSVSQPAAVVDVARGLGITAATGADPAGGGWDTGLTFGREEGDAGTLLIRAASSADVATVASTAGVTADHGLELSLDPEDTSGTVVIWADGDSADRFPIGRTYPGSMTWAENDDVRMVAGVVPTWMPGARVLLYLPRGIGAADDRTNAVEVPTFVDPTGTGARVYAAQLDAGLVRNAVIPGEDVRVLFVDAASGAVFDPLGACSDLPAPCLAAQDDGGGMLASAVEALGGDVSSVVLGPGVQPPSGVTSARQVSAGVTAATTLSEGTRLDLGEDSTGGRVWIDLRMYDLTAAPELYRGAQSLTNQPYQVDFSSAQDDYSATTLDQSDDTATFGSVPAGTTKTYLWMDADQRAVELPTVSVPGTDGRSAYAYLAQPGSAAATGTTGVVFVAEDGSLTAAGCGQVSESECETTSLTAGMFDAVRAAMG
ncbi:hypothetical protein [Cellulomonas sp. PhB150]|uniref:hypothetical protein n=1 Tax=Cellulomonas sp. PhB150 TaxID=2485188 RepID=UPI000F4835D9|nr:hypothetical protein [Cellulomonas sp. PhB150]ROS31018.1 hypothetical protein EDF34_0669 [Cellulomonas sp. PhB150]